MLLYFFRVLNFYVGIKTVRPFIFFRLGHSAMLITRDPLVILLHTRLNKIMTVLNSTTRAINQNWHNIFWLIGKMSMQEDKDIIRNRPTDEGSRNDPNLRDEDARQGANTMSTSVTDSAKENLTRTSSDNFREDDPGDEKADKRFDE